MVLPNYIVAFIVFVVMILVAFIFKLRFMNRLSTQPPEKMRKNGIKAMDGHISWTLYENLIENWLKSQGIPHEKPESAEEGEYYPHSKAVPFFIVFTSPAKKEIDSMIYLQNLERPAKFTPIIRTPNLVPKYPECFVPFSELETQEWRTHLYAFYKDLRKRNKKRAKTPEIEENGDFKNSDEID